MNYVFIILLILAGLLVLFAIPVVRRNLLSRPLLALARRMKLSPQISATEKVALEAGQVGVEKEFFKGHLDGERLERLSLAPLSMEERRFLAGPAEELCKMCNDWETWSEGDLPEPLWQYLKEQKFFGIIIPKEYGGLGFSKLAHSEVVMKLSSHSLPLGITTMVPNSLGPAELLMRYGTKAQKEHYLPRLARGEEIPCFALTELEAGSDATALSATGTIVNEDGRLKIKLNWQKRWITLGAKATLIGIVFKLFDPNRLLGSEEEYGITCALVPAETPGIKHHLRHDPMGVPFINSPLSGKDVVILVNQVIGGRNGLGKGWRMLNECLSAGRGISLPSLTTGCAKTATMVVSAHTSIRHQFGLPLHKFEGVREPLAEIFGLTYILDALRRFSVSVAGDEEILPVISAIAKYNATELGRIITNHTMDVLGGSGLSRGPRNLYAHTYIAQPICITVEGANILTRSMIIFGQGIFRSHPYFYYLFVAMNGNNLRVFDRCLWKIFGHFFANCLRSIFNFLTRGRFIPFRASPTLRPYYRKLAWVSANFAFMTDFVAFRYGGSLKRQEHLTGRLADILSWQCILLAILKRRETEPKSKSQDYFLEWCSRYALQKIQQAFEGIYGNIRIPGFSWFWNYPVLWLSRFNPYCQPASDELTDNLCEAVLNDEDFRRHLVEGIYYPMVSRDIKGSMERAYQRYRQTQPLYNKLINAEKNKSLPKDLSYMEMASLAEKKGLISPAEYESFVAAEKLRLEALEVDAFSSEDFLKTRLGALAHQAS